jgi:hypothetical protein
MAVSHCGHQSALQKPEREPEITLNSFGFDRKTMNVCEATTGDSSAAFPSADSDRLRREMGDGSIARHG